MSPLPAHSASTLRERAWQEPESVEIMDVVDHLVYGDREARRRAFEAYGAVVEARPEVAADAAARLEEHLTADDRDTQRRASLAARATIDCSSSGFERLVPRLRALGEERGGAHKPAIDALATLALEQPEAVASAVETIHAICHEPVEPVGGGTRPGSTRAARPDRRGPLAPERERRDRVRVRAAAGLTRIAAAKPAAMDPVVSEIGDLLDDDHRLIRAAACEVLESVATTYPDSVADVAEELAKRGATDPEQPVPWRAADALVALAGERPARVGRAVRPVAGGFSTFLDSRKADRRRTGTRLLVAAAAVRPASLEPVVATLRELVGDEDPVVEERVMAALSFVAADRARTLLATLDRRSDYRTESS